MNTFLPFPNFRLSTHVLDARRLGKQRLECMQILRLIAGVDRTVWQHHPATRMWEDYGPALALYMHCAIEEWTQRGYVNNLLSPRTVEGTKMYEIPREWATCQVDMPPWLGHERLHASHRAALLKKDPDWYAQFCWSEPGVIDYFWPGRWPVAGDILLAPDGSPGVVVQRLSREVLVVQMDGTTERQRVTRRQVMLREWQAATRG